ncbi:uncharacterized protein LOC133543934 [Nerophis ophidion]|uniref:uncharacterized protein LOC133543934 n=1 Tax=Nerophis ophidion TaxID=159077 RepID=UPI002ADFABD2|nr:uncharacterized protein LOC133543934 [Nerophis ophidion]
MAAIHDPLLALLLLLAICGLHCSSPGPSCPESCRCPRPSVLNCSTSGLSVMSPRHIQDLVAELDFSHNLLEGMVAPTRPLRRLRSVRLGNNSITRLSLCIQRQRCVKGHGCVAWAPDLQLLSAERNRLRRLPEGLPALGALEILQLSFNNISSIQPGELYNLHQLRELHLQHNLISSLQSHAIQHLKQLKIFDVSFNKLTSLHSSLYLSLRNIAADVNMVGNRWRCDCSMRSIRRWMAYDRSRDIYAKGLVCADPPVLAGKDLLQLEDDELICRTPDTEPQLHQDMMVDRGSEVLLSCASEDPLWWTPSSKALKRLQSTLLIHHVMEEDTGLYVCLSKDHKVVSVFHLQIRANRKPRSVSGNSQLIIPQEPVNKSAEKRNRNATQSDLTLAVCLSVFITFLVAFILGVLARPCIDVLWSRITKKKSSPASDSVSSERQYDNEAFSEEEYQEVVQHHRERRVTFSKVDFREGENMEYYDTIISSGQERTTDDAVIESETVSAKTQQKDDSGSESDRNGSEVTRELSIQNQEDVDIASGSKVEQRRGSSCSFGSSLYDEVSHEDQFIHKPFEREKDSVQQRGNSYKLNNKPQTLNDSTSEIGRGVADTELWQESEEQFDFSDSVRSTSPRTSSRIGSFNHSEQIVKRGTLKTEESSSSNSYVSDNEPSHYTVNPDEEDVEEEQRRSQTEARVSVPQRSDRLPPLRSKHFSSPQSSVTDDDSGAYPVHLSGSSGESDVEHTPKKPNLVVHVKSPSSMSFPGENETHVKRQRSPAINNPETHWPTLDVEHIPRINRHLDIKRTHSLSSSDSEESTKPDPELSWPAINVLDTKAPGDYAQTANHRNRPGIVGTSGVPSLSSSSDSEKWTENTKVFYELDATAAQHRTKEGWPVLDLERPIPVQRRLDIKSPTLDLSSSSDSEDATTNHITEHWLKTTNVTSYPIKGPPTQSHEPQTHWPSVDLEDSFRIKRRLDFKVPSPASEFSFSSDSDNETIKSITKQEHGATNVTKYRTKILQKPTEQPQGPWPLLNLEDSFRIKRRLDFKVPLLTSDSLISSNRENETTIHITEQEQGSTNVARHPIKASPRPSHEPQILWPSVDLEDSFKIKRRLDFKVPSPASEFSFSSDSDNETIKSITKEQGTTNVTKYRIKTLPIPTEQPQGPWPLLNLEDSFRIKRRLDFKVPSLSSDSLISSNRENETTIHITKQEQGSTNVARHPIKASPRTSYEPQRLWPSVDLEDSFRIKRRLDFKVPSPASEFSFNSDSDNETIKSITKEQGATNVSKYHIKTLPTPTEQPQGPWPLLNLEDSFRIKRRLNFKVPSLTSDSLISSNRENETTIHMTKQEQGSTNVASNPVKASPRPSHELQRLWPSVDLEDSFRIKRRLDFKVSSQTSDSSSSNSGDKTTNHIIKQEQMATNVTGYPIKTSPKDSPKGPWPSLDLEESFRVKRCLAFKVQSQTSDRLSSSGIEEETTNRVSEQKQKTINITRYPIQEPLTPSHEPQRVWPSVDFEDSFRIKRRLDFKVPSPTTDSSSSYNDNETTNCITKQEQGSTNVIRYPIKTLPTPTEQPQGPWPSLNLEGSLRIKRHLAFKVQSPTSDLLSSSQIVEEITNPVSEQKQKTTIITKYPIKRPSTQSHEPQGLWPSVDFEDSFRIKRRLDFKVPSQTSDSSSSNNSEDETTNRITKQEQVTTNVTPYPIKPAPKDPPLGHWPILDLEESFRVKRRLDFKEQLPSDQLSSSDSENETTNHITKQEQQTNVTRYSIKGPPTQSHEPQGLWPSVDLEDSFRIKRRLDFRVLIPVSDMSSRSYTEDETTNRITKPTQKETNVAWQPIKITTTRSHERQGPWPSLDLEDFFRIKRRLDIKVTSPISYSRATNATLSSSDSRTTNLSRHPVKLLPTPSHGPQGPWPTLDLVDSFQIKRRLDFKVSSPKYAFSSDSETTNSVTKLEPRATNVVRYPINVSPTLSHEQHGPRSSLDLEDSLRIKRRLDIKGPSPTLNLETTNVLRNAAKGPPTQSYEPPRHWSTPTSDASSRRDSEDETKSMTVHTTRQDQDKRWPALELKRNPRIQGRLDIRASSPPPSRTTGSDSVGETPAHVETNVQLPSNKSQYAGTQWPSVDLGRGTRITRRLDFKPTRSSADRKDHTLGGNPPSSSDEQEDMLELAGDTKTMPRSNLVIKRRLDIRAPSLQSHLSSSSLFSEARHSESSTSDVEYKNKDPKDSPKGSHKSPVISFPHSPKKDPYITLKKYSVVAEDAGDKTTSMTPQINPELESQWANMQLGFSRFRKRLEITSHARVPTALSSSSHPPDSPSSPSWRGIQHTESPLDTDRKSRLSSVLPAVGIQPPAGLQELRSSSSSENEAESIDYTWRRDKLPTPSLHGTKTASTHANVSTNSQTQIDGTLQHSLPDLNVDISLMTTPQPTDHMSNNEMMDDTAMYPSYSPIQYRRLIIKASSLPSTTSSTGEVTTQHGSSYSTRYQYPSLAPRTAPSQSFQDVLNRQFRPFKSTIEDDQTSEIRWTGVGGRLSDLSIGQQQELQTTSSDSLPSVRTDAMRNRQTADKKEMRGLSALRAMSSERHTWEREESVDPLPPSDALGRFQHESELLFSARSASSRATDFSYDIPRYRTHAQPAQEIPPPIPETPLPDEAVELSGRSAQKTETRSVYRSDISQV